MPLLMRLVGGVDARSSAAVTQLGLRPGVGAISLTFGDTNTPSPEKDLKRHAALLTAESRRYAAIVPIERVVQRVVYFCAAAMPLLDLLPALKSWRIILASASPRRRELLTQLGLVFTVMPSTVRGTCAVADASTVCDWALWWRLVVYGVYGVTAGGPALRPRLCHY